MTPGQRFASRILCVVAMTVACLALAACGDGGPKKGAAPAPSAAAAGSAAPVAGEGAAATHGAAVANAPPGGAAAPTGSYAPAPGTLSVRFIARKKETGVEIPAGSFEVKLVALESIRNDAGPGTSVSLNPAPAPSGAPIGKAAPAGVSGGPHAGATYQGPPEQILVTQPDGTKRTFVAGLKPGLYAMRITAKGRRMLLEPLKVGPDDKLVDRTLAPE